MNTRSLNRIVGIFAVMCLFATVGWATEGVSPGAADRLAAIESRCPTFSWQHSDNAVLYELVAYALPSFLDDAAVFSADLGEAEEVLFVTVPGGASSWTPGVDKGLEPGLRYVWFVRGVTDTGKGENSETSEWSNGRFFRIQNAPSENEFRRALEVLRRWEETGGGDRTPVYATSAKAGASTRMADGGPLGESQVGQLKSAPTAPAAIRGAHPETTTEAYGVVGSSASAQGAGVAAVNTAGGPDLVLDGSEDLLPDAEFSESGINRPWGSPQTFNIQNSTGLGMTLQVDGVDVVTTLSDLDSLGALSCGSGQIAKWNGSAWQCFPDEDHLSALSCAEGEIAKLIGSNWVCAADNDTVYIPGVGSIGSAEVLDNSLTADDFAANSVGISEIDTGAIFEPVQNTYMGISLQVIDTDDDIGETLTSKTLSAPTAGTALATASCNYFCTSCSVSNTEASAYTSIMTTNTGSVRAGKENYIRAYYNPYGDEWHSMTVTDVFSVSEGVTTFYLRSGIQTVGESISIGLCSLSVIFVPN